MSEKALNSSQRTTEISDMQRGNTAERLFE